MPRILIVDDDPVTSLLLSDLLVEPGHETLGPVHSVSAALALLDNCQADAAIIDVRLGAEDGHPVADRLARENVPFIFATGFGGEAIKTQACWRSHLASKPCTLPSLGC